MSVTTIREIAAKAGVSIATVSRVLTNVDYPVKEETRKLVHDVANKLGYQPNYLARGLRTDRSGTIGVVVDNIEFPFVAPIIRGIQDYLQDRNYIPIIVNTDFDTEMEQDAINLLAARSVDGFIFAETWFRGQIDQLEKLGKPYVFVHRLFNASIKNSIVPDDYEGAKSNVEYLLNLGHRCIAFINGPGEWHSSQRRYEGFLRAHQDNGLSICPEFVCWADWEVDGGYLAAKKILASEKPPTAVFAANDLMAVGVLWAANELGIKVPEQLSIIGFDNRPICTEIRPMLTTYRMPAYEMGKEGAKKMWQLLHKEIGSFKEIIISGELIERNSCASATFPS